ncbi:hypothetical protein E2C01_030591 [Portunus trituberculatus]|uniref:Uncharacterized protein n=1 Tax=Portunus trituberculatus TaxID=210409 RepID=A0A5B7EV74_PORTR|nr:hypothetical protein [Portunus trituberculatus]
MMVWAPPHGRSLPRRAANHGARCSTGLRQWSRNDCAEERDNVIMVERERCVLDSARVSVRVGGYGWVGGWAGLDSGPPPPPPPSPPPRLLREGGAEYGTVTVALVYLLRVSVCPEVHISPPRPSARRGNPPGAAPREGHGVTLTVALKSRDRHVVTELVTFMLVYNYAIFKSSLSKSRRRDDLAACVSRAQGLASH